MFGWTAKGMMFRHSQGQRLLAPVPKKLQLTALAASIRASIRNKDTLVAAAGLRFYRIPLANRPTRLLGMPHSDSFDSDPLGPQVKHPLKKTLINELEVS